MTATACPAETTLIDFSSGTLDDHQAAVLAGHVTACLQCQSRIDSLSSPDPLLTSLRALSGHQCVPDELTLSLIQRLREQPVSQSGEELSQATVARQSSPKSSPASSLVRMFQSSLSAEELGRVPGYRILNELGHGGMGVVFRAEDLALHREVAVKFMHPELAFSESHAARFLREARTMAAVQSEYLVPIYSVQEYAASFGPLPFIVMPLLRGQSLWNRLQAPIPISETLQIGIQILRALRDIHRGRIIHRDLKPANIWLEYSTAENGEPESEQGSLQKTRYPRVKVMDLGLVRVESEETRLTQSGGLAGTPANGLTAAYFNTTGNRLYAREYQYRTNSSWNDWSPLQSVPVNGMARYTGYLVVPRSGRYTLVAWGDDRLRLAIDGHPMLEAHPGLEGGTVKAIVELTAGTPHEIAIEFVDHRDWGSWGINWIPPEETAELPIPLKCLFPNKQSLPKQLR